MTSELRTQCNYVLDTIDLMAIFWLFHRVLNNGKFYRIAFFTGVMFILAFPKAILLSGASLTKSLYGYYVPYCSLL